MGFGKTALVLGGIGLAVNEIAKSGSNRSANVPKTTTPSKTTLDTQAVVKAIAENPNLLAMVRGEKGDAGNGYKATSTSSTAIATGSKTFDVGTPNLAYTAGARVRVTVATDATKFMEGVVSAYTGNTLTVLVDTVEGTGTFATWNVNVTGERGAAGSHGASGDSVQNYGLSLIKNGALEEVGATPTPRWTGTGLAVAADLFEGMKVLEASAANNTSYIWIRTDRLYKAEYFVKGASGNHSCLLNLYKADNTAAPKTDASSGAYFKFNSALPTNFTKTVGYIGGVGTNNMNVSAGTVKAKLSFLGHGGAVMSVAKLVVTEVSLGEPVPYNLAYLPTWQTVYDPTTGDIGVYNGTAVVWAS